MLQHCTDNAVQGTAAGWLAGSRCQSIPGQARRICVQVLPYCPTAESSGAMRRRSKRPLLARRGTWQSGWPHGAPPTGLTTWSRRGEAAVQAFCFGHGIAVSSGSFVKLWQY